MDLYCIQSKRSANKSFIQTHLMYLMKKKELHHSLWKYSLLIFFPDDCISMCCHLAFYSMISRTPTQFPLELFSWLQKHFSFTFTRRLYSSTSSFKQSSVIFIFSKLVTDMYVLSSEYMFISVTHIDSEIPFFMVQISFSMF